MDGGDLTVSGTPLPPGIEDHLVATFELEPPGSARALAIEESTGTEEVPAAMAASVGGKVLSEGDGRAVIAWPWRNWGANLPQLMASVLVGEGMETARFTRCRLIALEWPEGLVHAVGGGPRLGIDGVRSRLGATGRPLLGGIVKPSLGLAPAEVAATAGALARGGCDLVKDDELLADPEWCPLAERVPAVAEALAAADRPCLYAVNVSGPVDTLLDRASVAVAAGAGAIMVNAFAMGIDAVRAMAGAGLDVPVFAHRVGAGPIVRNPEVGVDGSVLCELTRVAGADFVQIGGFGGKLFDTRHEVAANLAACRRPLAGARVPVPVNGGGVWAGSVPEVVGAAGHDVMLLVGAGAYEHPEGVEAGARSVRQAIDAVVQGIALKEAAVDAPELAAALSHFGASS
ncbi:MAG: RuBisCO large subunit C-terminal-like domain-containing protein [Actinomycetota bacterium]|nr:RuBisCO large subunit C-terminal-like domain-containing protein [Actinomycetota bacterium]